MDRLPRVISQKYPELSFITIYPSEVEEEAGQGMGIHGNLNILKKERIKIGLESSDIESAINDMIAGDKIFEHIEIERITRRLLENSSDYTPEVMPGVVLYESHTSKVNEQVLFIGVHKKGLNIQQTANQAHVIIVLLSPKDMKPQDHLKALNNVIKLIRPGDDVEKIKSAKNVQEIISAMMDKSNLSVGVQTDEKSSSLN